MLEKEMTSPDQTKPPPKRSRICRKPEFDVKYGHTNLKKLCLQKQESSTQANLSSS
jgi:hypothetical protein